VEQTIHAFFTREKRNAVMRLACSVTAFSAEALEISFWSLELLTFTRTVVLAVPVLLS